MKNVLFRALHNYFISSQVLAMSATAFVASSVVVAAGAWAAAGAALGAASPPSDDPEQTFLTHFRTGGSAAKITPTATIPLATNALTSLLPDIFETIQNTLPSALVAHRFEVERFRKSKSLSTTPKICVQ
ncbi:hypothetical protein BSKO_03308 [Bryopsis sp. KO-2023]|nr:hypothetical protein BSKO_03308 [Bryopsis sp. KO-2023]